MPSHETEGEGDVDVDNVYNSTFLKNATRKSDLLSRLSDLHKSLSTLSQEVEDRPRGLKNTAMQLVSGRILGHQDKDVRLMAACCLVDVLRVYAPDAPFGNEEVVTVFEVIIVQLQGLATHDTSSGIGAKIFYILSSLSTFKSCVLPVILAQSDVPGAAELVPSLFDALLSSINDNHSEEGIR
jgi:sister-chromatid-cohesion protein PDS5